MKNHVHEETGAHTISSESVAMLVAWLHSLSRFQSHSDRCVVDYLCGLSGSIWFCGDGQGSLCVLGRGVHFRILGLNVVTLASWRLRYGRVMVVVCACLDVLDHPVLSWHAHSKHILASVD